jgi:hypothetical protein
VDSSVRSPGTILISMFSFLIRDFAKAVRRSSLLAVRIKLNFSEASLLANSSPIPEEAPVTRAHLPYLVGETILHHFA